MRPISLVEAPTPVVEPLVPLVLEALLLLEAPSGCSLRGQAAERSPGQRVRLGPGNRHTRNRNPLHSRWCSCYTSCNLCWQSNRSFVRRNIRNCILHHSHTPRDAGRGACDRRVHPSRQSH